jgi:flagellar L-ring protein precursor FlgH
LPQRVGDMMKIKISESVTASSEASSSTSRESKLSSKGPGSKATNGLLATVMNQDAEASGSSSFKGDGRTDRSAKFTGEIPVSVINVLPNGYLVVAGERKTAVAGDISVLRLSGVVNPRDMGVGNTMSSNDLLNGRIELVTQGEVSDASTRTWLQRVLARALAVW